MDEDYKRPWQVLDVQTGISLPLAGYVRRMKKKVSDRDDAGQSVSAEASQSPPALQTTKARSQMTETILSRQLSTFAPFLLRAVASTPITEFPRRKKKWAPHHQREAADLTPS